ncbi:MAG: hypothetical protein R3F61_01440 [Myxococcota bacterium]
MEPPFELGWPYLRTLDDTEVKPAEARREALKLLKVNDPYWTKTVFPREIARRYLRGYIVAKPFHEADALKAAVAGDEPIDRGWFRTILEKKLGPSASMDYGAETYDFRLAEVVFLFEAFLGAEVVAEDLVDHLIAALEHPKWWGDAFFQDHDNNIARRLVPVLGWLRLRMEPARWAELVARVDAATVRESPKLPGFRNDLRILADDRHPLEGIRHAEWIAMQRRDQAWITELYEGQWTQKWGYWNDPQYYHVLGRDRLANADLAPLRKLAKWQLLQVVEQFGAMEHPAIPRLMRALVDVKAASAAATAWLEAHGQTVESRETLSPRQMRLELAAMMQGAGDTLAALGGDAAKERAALASLFARYTELRAALGEEEPDAYFTHALGEAGKGWKADAPTTTRWFELAVEVTGA